MGFALFRGNRGENPILGAYGENGILFSMVSRLATATSKADWTLYRKAKSGLKEDREPVPVHACIARWERPNPFMHRRRFVETVQQHIDLVGEGSIIASHQKIMGDNIPIELWPVRPDRIKPVADPYEFIKGYVYTSPDGDKMPLEISECSRLIMPDPSDPYRGMGPVQSVMRDLDSGKYSSEWNARFFENSAEPGGVIEVPEELDDRSFDRLRDQWDSSHRGVSKAHRVAILEAGAKWNGTSFSQKDMQFVELSSLSDEKVRQAFGYPKPMLGGVDDVNRANAEAGEYVFAKWLIEDRLDRWRDWLNFDLLPQYGKTAVGLEWDYESPVPENSDARNAAVTANANALALLADKGFDVPALLSYLGMPEITYTKPEPKVVQMPAPPNDPNATDPNAA
jgi:HK97 family phage portal protein